jgi:hypothetical protein
MVFTSLDIAKIFYRARSSAMRPTPNLEDQACTYVLSDRVAQLYAQAPDSLSSPSTTRGVAVEVF